MFNSNIWPIILIGITNYKKLTILIFFIINKRNGKWVYIIDNLFIFLIYNNNLIYK